MSTTALLQQFKSWYVVVLSFDFITLLNVDCNSLLQKFHFHQTIQYYGGNQIRSLR